MDEVEIIELTPKRWKEYKNLRLEMLLKDPQAFGQRYDKSIKDPDSVWKNTLIASETRNKVIALFAQSKGKLIGNIGAFFHSNNETKDSAQIFGVYINSGYRQQGIAKKLQQKLLSELRKIPGINKVRVMVNNSQKAAVNLYKQGGFKQISVKTMTLGDGKEYEVGTLEQNLHTPHPDPLP